MTDEVAAASNQQAMIPAGMGTHYAVFLRKGPNWHTAVSPEDEALHNRHLAFLKSLYDSGKTLNYGPLTDGPDGNLRGLFVMRADSVDAVRALLGQDPRVQAGDFVLDIFTWQADTMAWRER